jgi:diphosphomevalonate decarboxylase
MNSATAISFPNIAFIKYWGNQDHALRIPSNGSLSMNLAGLETRTTVRFSADLLSDSLILNNHKSKGPALARVSAMLDRVRDAAGMDLRAAVDSSNNFPMGAGIASSASAFSALALAASAAAGLDSDEAELSRLARTGSGSASRSVPGGFVEWQTGSTHEDSYAFSIAPVDHWDLVDCVAVVSDVHKATGSTEGHTVAVSSPLQAARVADAERRLDQCRQAIMDRDFASFADVVEQDSNVMHGVMMTGSPRLLYWQPGTLAVMHAVQKWRSEGIEACYTIDAGPNVHVLCPSGFADEIEQRLRRIAGVLNVLRAPAGGPARIV